MPKRIQPKWGHDGVINKTLVCRNAYWDDKGIEALLSDYGVEYSTHHRNILRSIRDEYVAWQARSKDAASRKEQRRALELTDKKLRAVTKALKRLSLKSLETLQSTLTCLYWSRIPHSHAATGCEEWTDLSLWVSRLISAITRIRHRTNKYAKLLQMLIELEKMLHLLDADTQGDLVLSLTDSMMQCHFNEDGEQGPIELYAFFYRIERIHQAININIEEYKKPGRPIELDLRFTVGRLLKFYTDNINPEITHSSDYGQAESKGGDPQSAAGQFLKRYFGCINDRVERYPSALSSLLAEIILHKNTRVQSAE